MSSRIIDPTIDRQVYCPPWEVCRELNVRVRVVVVPDVSGVPTVMSPPLVTTPSESSHSTVGDPLPTSTVHVSTYISPAVAVPVTVMSTVYASVGMEVAMYQWTTTL